MTDREWWDSEAETDVRYRTLAWGGDGTPDQVEPTIQAIVDNIGLVIDAAVANGDGGDVTIMEIGCGPGRILRRFAAEYPDYYFLGLDVSPRMVAQAGDWPDNVMIAVTDTPSTISGLFDVIYSVEVFQHLEHDAVRDYLRFASEHLKPTGYLVFQVVVSNDEGSHLCHPMTEQQMRSILDEFLMEHDHLFHLSNIHDEWRWVVTC